MKTLTAIAYTLMSMRVLAMLALMPGATTAAESGDPIELGFVEVHVEFGSGIVGPDIPPGIELIYGVRAVPGLPPACGPQQHASLFDGVVVPPSNQTQTFDIFREDDPVDFDIVTQLLTNGCPDFFRLEMGFAGFSTSGGIGGTSLEIQVTPHSHILFIRMTVPPFDIIHDPENPILIKIAPPGTEVRLAAFGFSPPREVAIDIKPGSADNPINPRSAGVVPVAILTTDTFDATTVDPSSVEFGPDGAIEAHRRGHIEDVDGDGDDDLVLHFNTRDAGIQCGDTSVTLTGQTFSEQEVEGTDAITTVGCR
jgi:hypothetical protein